MLPPDTVYGLVCVAANTAAVADLYTLKLRDHTPGTVIANSIDQLVELGIKRRYLMAVEQFWPHPISIVIPVGAELNHLDFGKGSLACRVVAGSQELLNLLTKTGPLITSSANHPGQPTATTIQNAKAYFGDDVDFYVDGGDLSGRQPSTLIRVVDDAIEILREGAVNRDESGRVSR